MALSYCIKAGDDKNAKANVKNKDFQERNMKAVANQPGRSGSIRSPGPLGSPMLAFDLNAEIERLRNENAWQGGRNSKTLVKHPDLWIILTVL